MAQQIGKDGRLLRSLAEIRTGIDSGQSKKFGGPVGPARRSFPILTIKTTRGPKRCTRCPGMSSDRAVSLTFQSCSRSFESRNARSASCLNSSNVVHDASDPIPVPSSAVLLPTNRSTSATWILGPPARINKRSIVLRNSRTLLGHSNACSASTASGAIDRVGGGSTGSDRDQVQPVQRVEPDRPQRSEAGPVAKLPELAAAPLPGRPARQQRDGLAVVPVAAAREHLPHRVRQRAVSDVSRRQGSAGMSTQTMPPSTVTVRSLARFCALRRERTHPATTRR